MVKLRRHNQVNASSSQVLGMWPLRVTYTNPASINSALQRHSVVRDFQPRFLTTDQATVRSPLLLPRYCPANSSSNLQAWGLRAANAGLSNTLCTMPVKPSVYLLPLYLFLVMMRCQLRHIDCCCQRQVFEFGFHTETPSSFRISDVFQ